MKAKKIADALGVSVQRLRHMGFSLKSIVVKKVFSRTNGCLVQILRKERQV